MASSSESSRSRRVGEQIQRELAQLIQQEVKDPRIKWVTVSAVKASKDFSHATIFFTVLGDYNEDVDKNVLVGLEKASGFLRRELGRRMKLRIVPELHFKYDDSTVRGTHLTGLIDAAIASDKK
ncbi:MAG: 30S ribosome-binding factor RbfA [Gammaproteobacteria bacterium]|nr:30S ribosome-binding factor RbfA [Gammaproteobacteria bacterium]